MLRSKNFFIGILSLALVTITANAAPIEEWKGKGYDKLFQVSALSGVTVMGTTVGFTVQPALAVKIIDRGFIPGINNQIYGEVAMGPSFMSLGTGFQMSAHMRWDFHRDDYWSFYGLGGLGWDMIPTGFTTVNALHARFAVGSFWHLFPEVSLRGEISHELIAVGASFMF